MSDNFSLVLATLKKHIKDGETFFFLYLNKIVDFFPNLRKIWSRDTGKGEQISEKMKVDSV